MKKNLAIPVAVLKGGDAAQIAKYGPQDMTHEDMEQHHAAAIAHDEFIGKHGHRIARSESYPSVGDQLDALWKALGALAASAGYSLPEEAVAMMQQIVDVKKAHPKPGAKS